MKIGDVVHMVVAPDLTPVGEASSHHQDRVHVCSVCCSVLSDHHNIQLRISGTSVKHNTDWSNSLKIQLFALVAIHSQARHLSMAFLQLTLPVGCIRPCFVERGKQEDQSFHTQPGSCPIVGHARTEETQAKFCQNISGCPVSGKACQLLRIMRY